MLSTSKERRAAPDARPPIALTVEDHGRLSMLADAALKRTPDEALALSEEVDRAHLLTHAHPSSRIVRMGSQVVFRDEASGKMQAVTLVYPDNANITQGKISVLTPVGTALIGVCAGESIAWKTRSGELKHLTVVQVKEPDVV